MRARSIAVLCTITASAFPGCIAAVDDEDAGVEKGVAGSSWPTECITDGCKNTFEPLGAVAASADLVTVGRADCGRMDPEKGHRSTSLSPDMLNDEECSRLRFAVMGAVQEAKHGLSPKVGEPFKFRGDAQQRWGSRFVFDGCEGNRLQGQKDATAKALEQCASFLLDPKAGVSYQMLAIGDRAYIYANQNGASYSSLRHGSAAFVGKAPLAEHIMLRLKPTGRSVVYTKIPLPRMSIAGWSESFRASLRSGKPIQSLSALSEAYLENRINTIKLSAEVPTAIASIALTGLTLNAAGASASAANLGTKAAMVWGIIHAVSTTAGILSDVAAAFGLYHNINVIRDPVLRSRAQIALAVVDVAAAVGILTLLQNPQRSARLFTRAGELLGELRIVERLKALGVGRPARLSQQLLTFLRANIHALARELKAAITHGVPVPDIVNHLRRRADDIAQMMARMVQRPSDLEAYFRKRAALLKELRAADRPRKKRIIQLLVDEADDAYRHGRVGQGNCRNAAHAQFISLTTGAPACGIPYPNSPNYRARVYSEDLFMEAYGTKQTRPVSATFDTIIQRLKAKGDGAVALLWSDSTEGGARHGTLLVNLDGDVLHVNNQGWGNTPGTAARWPTIWANQIPGASRFDYVLPDTAKLNY